MASYHFSAQLIQRSKGRSAVAAAAYRSGSVLADNRTGQRFDFSRRRGVVSSEILAPDGAADFLKQRETLWNHAEAMEKRKDAQVAREINLALPHELDAKQRRETLLNFVREAFVDRGMVADVAVHAPVPEKGDHPDNHHAHIMLTMRRATTTGLHPVKTREWNSDALLEEWRALWALRQNEALERAGQKVRVDHRTLLAQKDSALKRRDFIRAVNLDREPQIHVGPSAAKAAQRRFLLRSVDRVVGPPRKQSGNTAARRVVRYREIDQGSRAAHRAVIVKANWLRRQRAVAKWQARSVRLRLHQVRMAKLELAAKINFRFLFNQRNDWRWLERREVPHSLAQQVEQAARSLAHVQKRGGLLDRLLAEVDRTLAGLLLSQVRTTGRPSPHLQSNNPRGSGWRPGRSRARYPIGPSNDRPGSA
jgi:hypothetical protein